MTSEEFHDALYRERCRREALEAKVRELEAIHELDNKEYEGYKQAIDRKNDELTASRQQVERLVEAMNDLRSVVRHFWNDDHPAIFALDAACNKADEALASVEKDG